VESREHLESVYTTNFESAKKYVQQNNLPDAKSSLQKAAYANVSPSLISHSNTARAKRFL